MEPLCTRRISESARRPIDYDFFSLAVKADSVTLEISHTGYTPTVVHLMLEVDTQLNVLLQPVAGRLDDIEVVARSGESPVETVQMSEVKLPVAAIRVLPALAGEVDV